MFSSSMPPATAHSPRQGALPLYRPRASFSPWSVLLPPPHQHLSQDAGQNLRMLAPSAPPAPDTAPPLQAGGVGGEEGKEAHSQRPPGLTRPPATSHSQASRFCWEKGWVGSGDANRATDRRTAQLNAEGWVCAQAREWTRQAWRALAVLPAAEPSTPLAAPHSGL